LCPELVVGMSVAIAGVETEGRAKFGVEEEIFDLVVIGSGV